MRSRLTDGLHPDPERITGGPIFLIAPESAQHWISHFIEGTRPERIVFTGEGAEALLDGWPGDREGTQATSVCILSSHETLLRDCALAEQLRACGHTVDAQSPECAALAVDKIAMKEAFDRAGFRSPSWEHAGTLGAHLDAAGGGAAGGAFDGGRYVVKNRHGTQSAGIQLQERPPTALRSDAFVERFVPGVEYSVVAYLAPDRSFTLPVVGKGRTTPELVPPWRRLRVCPALDLAATDDARLRELTLAVGRALHARGFVEIEYILGDDGEIYVLEINPRLAGTMRMAAMAADVALFSLPFGSPTAVDLPAVQHTAEIPYAGAPIVAPAEGVFATSRLTVSADTSDAALQALHDYAETETPGYAR